MDSQSLNRALMSSALWFAVTYGLGAVLPGGDAFPIMDVAVDSAIMGGAALASDALHGVAGLTASATTSAALTGACYAGIQKAYRGDNGFITNLALAGANDWAVDWIGASMAK